MNDIDKLVLWGELNELLAAIHGDNGQYVTKHGIEKAVEDAITLINKEQSTSIREIIKRLEGLQRYDHDGIHGIYPHRDGDLVDWGDIKDLIKEFGDDTN